MRAAVDTGRSPLGVVLAPSSIAVPGVRLVGANGAVPILSRSAMDIFTSGALSIGGEATSVIRVLREFGRSRPVPVGIIAQSVGRQPDEIRNVLLELQSRKIVCFDQANGLVTLIG